MTMPDRYLPTGPVTVAALDVLRDQLAPGASDAELDYFARVCNRLELSPFADQIVLIGRYDKRLKREVFRHQVTVAGRRTLASRTGRPYRVQGPEWCGPRDARTGELRWVEVWDDDDAPPYCARALVYFVEFAEPAANGTAKWSEFAQYGGDAAHRYLLPTWQAMPSHMLGKVAESMALRRAFPDVLTAGVLDGFDPSAGYVPAGDPDAVEVDDAGAEARALEARLARASTYPPPDPPVEVADVDPDPPPASTSAPRPGDQSTAHRLATMMGDADLAAFLRRHGIGDFGDVWPDAAVAELLDDGAA